MRRRRVGEGDRFCVHYVLEPGLTAWGHKPNPFQTGGQMTGGTPGTMAEYGFAETPVIVDNRCSETNTSIEAGGNWGNEFAIQFRRTGTVTGWADGLSVTYRSGGRSHVSHWPLGFTLCGTDGVKNEPAKFSQACGLNP